MMAAMSSSCSAAAIACWLAAASVLQGLGLLAVLPVASLAADCDGLPWLSTSRWCLAATRHAKLYRSLHTYKYLAASVTLCCIWHCMVAATGTRLTDGAVHLPERQTSSLQYAASPRRCLGKSGQGCVAMHSSVACPEPDTWH